MPAEVVPLPIVRLTEADLGLPALRFMAEPVETAGIAPEDQAGLLPSLRIDVSVPAA